MPILSSHPPEQVGQEVIDAGGPPPVRPQKRNCPQVRSPRSELPSKKRHLDHSSSSPVHHSNPRPRRRVIREDSVDFNFCLQMPDATGYEEPCQGQGNSFEESPPPSLHSEQQWDSDKLKEEHQSDDKSHECASSREEQDNEGPEEFTSHSLGPDLQQYTELQAQFTALEAQRNGEIREGIINHNDDGIVDIDTYQADQERQASSMDEDPLTSLRQSSVTVQGEPTSLPVDLPSQPYPPPPMNYLPCYFLSYSLDNVGFSLLTQVLYFSCSLSRRHTIERLPEATPGAKAGPEGAAGCNVP
ncbi:hypothetical protein PSTG_05605 [Puccinia striiformis f. sp. tritici PST-78]|uniref:Uncharacterized protein n=1 Tax=Puccinia striiformis f. sp. tritici PST-78 TaxID=1165861 RepID=A0A0L0VPN3_9BASI|nr:hypothetical protein PSTG_05605 [Puccinia striiformis f. sp. tritici PST-78]